METAEHILFKVDNLFQQHYWVYLSNDERELLSEDASKTHITQHITPESMDDSHPSGLKASVFNRLVSLLIPEAALHQYQKDEAIINKLLDYAIVNGYNIPADKRSELAIDIRKLIYSELGTDIKFTLEDAKYTDEENQTPFIVTMFEQIKEHTVLQPYLAS